MAVQFHTRLTRPFVGCLLVVLESRLFCGTRTVIILSAGLCLVIGAGFYACVIGCGAGDADYIAPLRRGYR